MNSSADDLDGFLVDNSGWTLTDINVLGGIQAGYDYQMCNNVVGVVLDWTPTALSRKEKNDPHGSENRYIKNDIDWISTLRMRTGLAIDRTLLYVTGGIAMGQTSVEWRDASDKLDTKSIQFGWTGGMGAEYKIDCNWSAGFELLYVQLANKKHTYNATNTFSHSDSIYMGRFTLNYLY